MPSSFHERTIPAAGALLRVRTYRPSSAQAELGGLVFFHAGDAESATHDALCRQLSLASGCVIAACDYRPRFPNAPDDAYFAACYVHEHADDFGIDHRRLGVGGVDLGAGLATTVARLAKERRNPPLVLQLLIAPRLDLRDGHAPDYATAAEREDPRCSPILAKNLIGLPPAWIAYGGDGPLTLQAKAYAERLREVQGLSTAWRFDETLPEQLVRECGRALERLAVAGG